MRKADEWSLPTWNDHAAAFEAIEHHPRPDRLLSELSQIVLPGGFIFLSWLFIFPLHE